MRETPAETQLSPTTNRQRPTANHQEYVSELLESSEPSDKFLVFAHHRELLDAIQKAVTKKKV